MSFDMHAPEPMTPAGLDLRNCRWMPLDVRALMLSDFWLSGSDAGRCAGIQLWCEAWHSVPAGSLPDDDASLARLAGYGRDVASWRTVRSEALRGFVLCSDGRRYHPVIAQKAIEAAQQLEAGEKRRQEWKDKKAKQRAAKDAKKSQNENVARTVPGDIPETSPRCPAFDNTSPDHTKEVEDKPLPLGGAGGSSPPAQKPKKRKRRPEQPFPDDWRENPELILEIDVNRRAAERNGIPLEEARRETHQFRSWAEQNDVWKRDWNATWSTRCGNYWTFRNRNRAGAGGAAPRQNGSSSSIADAAARTLAKRRDAHPVSHGAERREHADALVGGGSDVLELKALGRDRFA